MYTNADGLVVNTKELEFQDCIRESNPDIVVETKFTKEVKAGLICPEVYMIARRNREGKGRGGMPLFIRDNVNFRKY